MRAKTRSLKSDHRPLYDQAIEALNQFIEAGNFKPGDKLPSEGELAKQLGISRPTLREAMGNLESSGVIERRHGVGSFVTAPAQGTIRGGLDQLVSLRSLADSVGVRASCEDWQVEVVGSTQDLSQKLDLPLDTPLVHVQMTASDEDGCFIAYMDSYTPESYVEVDDIRAYKEGSLLNYMLEKGNLKLSYTHTNINSVAADKNIAKWLRVPEGKPLLKLSETYYSSVGRPLIQEYNYFITDCMDFHIVRRVTRR